MRNGTTAVEYLYLIGYLAVTQQKTSVEYNMLHIEWVFLAFFTTYVGCHLCPQLLREPLPT